MQPDEPLPEVREPFLELEVFPEPSERKPTSIRNPERMRIPIRCLLGHWMVAVLAFQGFVDHHPEAEAKAAVAYQPKVAIELDWKDEDLLVPKCQVEAVAAL